MVLPGIRCSASEAAEPPSRTTVTATAVTTSVIWTTAAPAALPLPDSAVPHPDVAADSRTQLSHESAGRDYVRRPVSLRRRWSPSGRRRVAGVDVRALVFDVFGTVVDWRDGVAREARRLLP